MDADLLIPATPELLDEWCGPVMWDGRPAVVAPNGLLFATEVGSPGIYYNAGFPMVSNVSLDLARAECRDRVARVLAFAMGIQAVRDGARWSWRGGREWSLRGDVARGMHAGSPGPDESERRFVSEMSSGMRQLARRRGMGRLWWLVPALAHLDPLDDTRLPDGSRRVDALALAAVWRAHVE